VRTIPALGKAAAFRHCLSILVFDEVLTAVASRKLALDLAKSQAAVTAKGVKRGREDEADSEDNSEDEDEPERKSAKLE